MQYFHLYGRTELVAASSWRPVTDAELCTACGACQEVCPFAARTLVEGRLIFSPGSCRGCGLCLAGCPSGAVSAEMAGAPC